MKTEKYTTNDENHIGLFGSHRSTERAPRQVSDTAVLSEAIATSRAYFRSLRAAEMAAWEMTGGDYVSSRFFAEAA